MGDEDSLEHVHAKFAHLRHAKEQARQEAEQREAVKDLYPDEEST